MSATTWPSTATRFRVRGDTVEIFPVYANDRAIRVEFFGDEIDRISEINVVTGTPTRVVDHVAIYPASHYVASKEKMAARHPGDLPGDGGTGGLLQGQRPAAGGPAHLASAPCTTLR